MGIPLKPCSRHFLTTVLGRARKRQLAVRVVRLQQLYELCCVLWPSMAFRRIRLDKLGQARTNSVQSNSPVRICPTRLRRIRQRLVKPTPAQSCYTPSFFPRFLLMILESRGLPLIPSRQSPAVSHHWINQWSRNGKLPCVQQTHSSWHPWIDQGSHSEWVRGWIRPNPDDFRSDEFDRTNSSNSILISTIPTCDKIHTSTHIWTLPC